MKEASGGQQPGETIAIFSENGGEEWPDEVTGSRENRRQMGAQQNQHRLHFAAEPSLNDECTVIHLSYVVPSALALLQSNHVKFDTLCSSEKGFRFREGGMSDDSNSFSAWEILPEDEPPLCIAVRRPMSPPRHYDAVNCVEGANASMWTVKELSLAKSMFYQSVIPMFLSSLSIIEAVTKQIIAFNKIFSEIAHTLPYTVYFLTAFLPAIFLRRFRNAMIPQFLWRRLCTDNKLAFVHVPQVKVSAQSYYR
ncbi:hypothetical protein RB195_003044 [Necator americanus]|uniref:Uncharacterized protein n=1 Tax=Necator americanus TaxID=51031 RepID=A0ABR1DN45_NECAM